MSAPSGRRLLVITSDLLGVGGIQRYVRSMIDVLGDDHDVEVCDLGLNGTLTRRLASVPLLAGRLRRRYDLVIVAHASFAASVRALGRRRGTPYVVVAYGVEIWEPLGQATRAALRGATSVWPISRFTAGQLRERLPGVRVGEPLGAGLAPLFFRDRASPPPIPTFVTVARLQNLRHKGIDLCLDAIGRVAPRHPIRYVVVGDGPDLVALRDEVRRLGLEDAVVIDDDADDEAVGRWYSCADAVVLVSPWSDDPADPTGEGLGLALLEGAAAGAPGIGARIGGTADAIVDGRTGWLVGTESADELAAVISEIVEHRELALLRGAAARDHVRREHTQQAFAHRLRAAVAAAIAVGRR